MERSRPKINEIGLIAPLRGLVEVLKTSLDKKVPEILEIERIERDAKDCPFCGSICDGIHSL